MVQVSSAKKVFDDRYEVISVVGRGSRSVVYHARPISQPSTEVALKVLIQRNGALNISEYLRKEALAMVSSRHRYVVRIDDFRSVDDLCYLAMEYAPERDLRTFTSKFEGRLIPDLCEKFLPQAAEALDFIHKAGIIHRDIKPDNILVMNPDEIRIADFGVALLPNEPSSIEELKAGVGTFDYMPPEVLEGQEFSEKSDIYSLGVAFYELMCGKHPFKDASMVRQIEVRRMRNIPHLSSIAKEAPAYLCDTIMRCIEFDPRNRISSARELRDILKSKEILPKYTKEVTAVTVEKPPTNGSGHEVKKTSSTPTSTMTVKDILEKSTESKKNELAQKKSDQIIRNSSVVVADPILEDLKKVGEETDIASVLSPTPKNSTVLKEFIINENEDPNPSYTPTESSKSSSYIAVPPEVKQEQHVSIINAPVENIVEVITNPTILPAQQNGPSNNNERIINPVVKDLLAPPSELETQKMEKVQSFSSDLDFNRRKTVSLTPEMLKELRSGAKKIKDDVTDDQSSHARTIKTPELHSTQILPANWKVALYIPKRIALAVLLIGAAIGIGLSRNIDTNKLKPAQTENTSEIPKQTSPIIPEVRNFDIHFPQLPSGEYHGAITGIMPGLSTPLTIISFLEQQKILVILGMEGWTPVFIKINDLPDGATLRVASNGFIFDLTGNFKDNRIEGTTNNIVDGFKGGWYIAPTSSSRK